MSRSLSIKPITCKLDYSYETVRQLSLFCRVILGNFSKSTELLSQENNPEWSDELAIPLVSKHMVHVEIHNKKSNNKSDLIGVGEYSLLLLDEGDDVAQWINIRDRHGKINGKVLVEFNFAKGPESDKIFFKTEG